MTAPVSVEPIDEQRLADKIECLAHRWATASYKKALGRPFEDFEVIKRQMRALLDQKDETIAAAEAVAEREKAHALSVLEGARASVQASEAEIAELRRALEGLVDCHARFTGEPGHDAAVWAEADDVARAALSATSQDRGNREGEGE